MLHTFLLAEREEILALCAKKILKSADEKMSTNEMEEGLPRFYDELIDMLKWTEQEATSSEKEATAFEHIGRNTAARHGEESLKLGYTVSQVVHGYGSICQGITEYAQQKNEEVTVREFRSLNLCLDVAIAEAVTAFDKGQRERSDHDEVLRLGFLAHELRNALSNAYISLYEIKSGTVGTGGYTGRVLEESLGRMRDLIDRSLTEVRLKSFSAVERRRCHVLQLVSEVEAASTSDAKMKFVQFSIDVAPELEIFADHHFMVSALGNLVQNAIKFTKIGSIVWIRARQEAQRVYIEVEDQCGGLSTDKIEELFQPFSQMDTDRSGVGLGLAICRQAVSINDGFLSARDIPGKGCVFIIDLPSVDLPRPDALQASAV